MSRGVNKVFLVGNLGKDPDGRTTQAGGQVVTLNIATDESYKDRSTGQLIPKTEWHRVVIFGRTAEVAANYLKKGANVYIEGRLQTRKWQSQEGIDRYATEIVVDISGQMQMLDSTNATNFEDSNPLVLDPKSPFSRPEENIYSDRCTSEFSESDSFDDEIPF